MTETAQHPASSRSRLEVWLFIAMAAIALLGFMSTLSSGDLPGVVSGQELKAAVPVVQELDE